MLTDSIVKVSIAFILVNSHIVYRKLGNNISLQNFKIIVAQGLIDRYSNRKISLPTSMPSKQKSHEPSVPREVPIHMPEFQEKRMRCLYSKNEGSDHKTFVYCQICGLYLCLTKKRNYLLKYQL